MRKYIWMVSFLLVFACKCDSSQVSTTAETPVKKESAKVADNVKAPQREIDTRNASRGAEGKVGTVGGRSLSENEMKKEMEKGDYYVDNAAVKVQDNSKPQGNVDDSLPASCALLGEAFMKKEFKIADNLMVNDATNVKSPAVKSCFFRWDNGILPNSGVFLQVMGNPVPDEVDNYAVHYIDGKKKGGEMDLGGESFQFKTFDVVGDDGAYSAEQGRYYWRVGTDRAFMLAFNLGMGSNTEYKHAVAVAKEVMKNYNNL